MKKSNVIVFNISILELHMYHFSNLIVGTKLQSFLKRNESAILIQECYIYTHVMLALIFLQNTHKYSSHKTRHIMA